LYKHDCREKYEVILRVQNNDRGLLNKIKNLENALHEKNEELNQMEGKIKIYKLEV
jgi:hypothetical protein